MKSSTSTPREIKHRSYNAVYVCAISSVASLGGLLFGYDWVVIGGAKPFYEKYFQLTSEQLIGWANSCALLGCLLISYGRRSPAGLAFSRVEAVSSPQ
jgi:MFS family permease